MEFEIDRVLEKTDFSALVFELKWAFHFIKKENHLFDK
jgi:hypothetical protein